MGLVDVQEALTKAWPWTSAFSRQLLQVRPKPFQGSHLLFGSDYSGDHKESRFRVYGFVIAAADASPEWAASCRDVRRNFLADGRRMSFKNLNDIHRRRALVPFLEAADSLEGHVVGIAVTKHLPRLSTGTGTMDLWKTLHGLQSRWDPKTFEQMVRVAQFFSLILAAWSSPGMHVSWITDDDSIVANAGRLDDAHQLAARLSSLYVPHDLGEFMMNTVAVDNRERGFEDFAAIPDLAAGMLAEVLLSAPAAGAFGGLRMFQDRELSEKSALIADWFWHGGGPLRKTCILIDRAAGGQFGVGELHTGS